MKLLDTFCKAGGAAMGYHRAGFEIVGVDIEPQPNFPFEFVQGDALEFIAAHGHEFDAIHASPPCQANSKLKSLHRHRTTWEHRDLIPQTRAALRATGKPFVIENVEGASLLCPVRLCGTQFDLKVYRHRLFEIHPVELVHDCYLPHPPHRDKTPSVGRGISPKGFISVTGEGGFGIPDGFQYACDAMGINWMSRRELSQAIPPAFTEWIGKHLLKFLETATLKVELRSTPQFLPTDKPWGFLEASL